MKLKLFLAASILHCLLAKQLFVEIDGDAYVMPTQKITADLLLNDPVYAELEGSQLPSRFWTRQTRVDISKLVSKYGASGAFTHVSRVLSEESAKTQFFTADGDLLLMTDVTPTPIGPVFKTAFEGIVSDTFRFSRTDLSFMRENPTHLIKKLRLGPTLANLQQEDLYHLTRFYFPSLEDFVVRPEMASDLIKQAISNLLLQLIENEGDVIGDLVRNWEDRETLVTMIMHNTGRLTKYLLDVGRVAGPNRPANTIFEYVATMLTIHQFDTLVKDGFVQEAVKFILNSGLIDSARVAKMIEEVIEGHGLGVVEMESWDLLEGQRNLDAFKSLLIAGIVLGKIQSSKLAKRDYFDRTVKKEAFEALWIGSTPEALQDVSKALSWISVYKPEVLLPTKMLRSIIGDPTASLLAKECLLKHMVLNGDKGVLIDWFWKLFGAGQAKFNVSAELRKRIMEEDPEIAFFAFPDAFEGRPPLSFKKSTILDLIKLGTVDGTFRSVNEVITKLVQLRMDMLSMEEIYTVMEWARKSHLSYTLGKQLFELSGKGEKPTLLKTAQITIGNVREWEGFPLAMDGSFSFETYRTVFTWVPYELDAELLQQFEMYSTQMDELDIAFMLKSTPYRQRVEQILRRRYVHITGKQNEEGIMQRVLRYEDILKQHSNDLLWLIDLARRHWDPTDLAFIKQIFLAHGFSEDVWKMIRFCPQHDVAEYLAVIKRFNNVPFPFIEHLRVERHMGPAQINEYIENNVSSPIN